MRGSRKREKVFDEFVRERKRDKKVANENLMVLRGFISDERRVREE